MSLHHVEFLVFTYLFSKKSLTFIRVFQAVLKVSEAVNFST